MTKEKNQTTGNDGGQKEEKTKGKKKFDKPFKQAGGTYFHYGEIIGRKNVFVTKEYMDLVANAIKLAELKMDIKNLAYVVMPNFFLWLFKLPENQDNPGKILAEVKGQVAIEIMKNLRAEIKDGAYEIFELFKGNERVMRSTPQKILWTFEAQAKNFEENKRYKVWTPKTYTLPINDDKAMQEKSDRIMGTPLSERWKLVETVEKYPYLYLSEDLQDIDTLKLRLDASVPAKQTLQIA